MSVFLDISAALDGHLASMPGRPDVAWENKKFTPVVGVSYLRTTLLPGDVGQATLGESGTDQNDGIYQIDVFTDADIGKNEAITIADDIANHFKRGTDLVYNGRRVTIRNVSRRTGINNDDGWFQVPLDIAYISFTEPRV